MHELSKVRGLASFDHCFKSDASRYEKVRRHSINLPISLLHSATLKYRKEDLCFIWVVDVGKRSLILHLTVLLELT